ncbi:DUF6541 family protein [Cellulosimicrobium cellulans]|uniref:Glycosyltransferase RgtA/B/C/D-like domain-containing protein n=1 Tax=Cellulosimicrobium cellulans TaxID=1710 RepID=A0A4Y4DW70_CELCE|nr:DUF6541 family protein [Cellulosimicrobium cellulans]GED09659.1 hypothetical protein CCE02nite_16580 [Cellulosimicrobium cellulans]
MLEWLPTAWIGLLAVLLLWLPGLAVGYAGGLRGLFAWGSAPLVSSALIGASAIVAGAVGLSWSVLVVLGATVLAVGVAWGVRAAAGGWRSPRVDRGRAVWRQVLVTVVVSLVVAGALQARRLMAAIGGPDHFSQTFDAPYHLNSVRLILESGDASSLHMTLTAPEATTSFYPALWHDLVSLLVQLSGGTDVVAPANWTTLVIACLVWPASMLVLARGLFGPRPVMLGLTVAVSFAMTQFPNQLTGFGVLYPNLLAYAVLPALLGLAWLALWRARGRARLAPLAFVGVGAVAVALAQPNGLFTLGYVAVPLLAHYVAHASVRAWRLRRSLPGAVVPGVVLVVLCVVAYWAAGQVSLVEEFRTQVSWPARMSTGEAVNDAVTLAAMHPSGESNMLVAGLVLVGVLVSAFVARWRWLPIAYVVLAWLFVVAASADGETRALLTGYWYGDVQRLASQLPLLAVPLATIGLTVVVAGVASLVQGSAGVGKVARAVFSVPVLAVLAALVLVVVLPRTTLFKNSYDYVAHRYELSPESTTGTLVDESEMRILDEVDRIVPEDAVVAGQPWDGSVLVWALTDRETLYPHLRMPLEGDRAVVADRLNQAGEDPEVCEAVTRLGLEYVLDLGGENFWGDDGARYAGLDGLVAAGVAEEVARVEDSRLLRITACAGTEG